MTSCSENGVPSQEDVGKYLKVVASELEQTNKNQLRQLDYSKATNHLLQKTNRRISWAVVLGLVSLIAVCIVSLFLFQISTRLTNSWAELVTLKKKLDENIETTKRAEAKSNDAKMAAEAAVKVGEEKGSVQIVAETDPVKARVSPLKVRIVSPAPKKVRKRKSKKRQMLAKETQSMEPAAIEVPLPVKSAKRIDLKR